MLGLMLDPKVPTDVRIEMAAAAAPLVHPRPKSFPKIRVDRFRTDFTVRRMEAKLTPIEMTNIENRRQMPKLGRIARSTP
jgi:hypothetical protein